MLQAEVCLEGLRVRVWQHRGSEHADQDRWVTALLGDRLRVAAIDGVTPWQSPAGPGGDAAQMAAAAVAGALLLPVPARDALTLANRMLHRPEVTPSRRQPMAAVAVADCLRDVAGVDAHVVVAADCEVWAADHRGALTLAAGGDFLRPHARAAWCEIRDRLPPGADLLSAEAETLDDPSTQVRHAVGRYRDPVWSEGAITAPALVVASDGCRLLQWAEAQEPVLAALPAWLEAVASRTRRDDLTCLLVEPVG